jgi:hypothetical protein
VPDGSPCLHPGQVRRWILFDQHKFSIVAAVLPPDGGTPEVARIETTEKAIRRYIEKQGGPAGSSRCAPRLAHSPAPAAGGIAEHARTVLGRAGQPVVQRPGDHAHRGALQRAVRQVDVEDRRAGALSVGSVKVGRGKWRRHEAHGRRAIVRVDLGVGPSHNVWV